MGPIAVNVSSTTNAVLWNDGLVDLQELLLLRSQAMT